MLRRTIHLVQPFLTAADIISLQRMAPQWHPHYNDIPLSTPLPCLYRRLHGFGRDHLNVSTQYTDAAPYFLFHMAWPFLDCQSRQQLCVNNPVMAAYAKLRFDAATAPVHTLRRRRPPYQGQTLDTSRVRLYAMALIRFDFNYGDFMRFLSGEYTYAQRDWSSVFRLIEMFAVATPPLHHSNFRDGDIAPADVERARRLVDVGAPLIGHYSCSYSSVSKRNVYNNHKNVEPVKDLVFQKLAKEEALSYQIVFPRWLWRFIPGLFIAAISFRAPKHEQDGGRLCTDLSTSLFHGDDGMVNEQIRRPVRLTHPSELQDETHLDENPPVYYGTAFKTMLRWIWNLRIDHPREDILLATNDISAAFHRILYNCGMAVCFSVVFDKYLAVPTGNVFGGTNSASLYMLHGELRAWLSTAADFQGRTTALANTVSISDPPTRWQETRISQATRDTRNPGSHALRQGPLQLGPQPSFVDDSGVADIRSWILKAINNSIMSAYIIFGFPKEDPRRPAINGEKFEPYVTWILPFLGFILNTRRMDVTWPLEKRQRLASLLMRHFLGPHPEPLSPRLISQVLGLVRNGALVSPYGEYLSLRLQFALNDAVSAAHRQHHRARPPNLLHDEAELSVLSYFWWDRHRIQINRDIIADVTLLHDSLVSPNADTLWSRKIGLLVDREPNFFAIGDACYEGLGGYCLELSYMFRITRLDLQKAGFDVPTDDNNMLMRVREARLRNDNSNAHMAHSNILEFVTIIVNLWLLLRLCSIRYPSDTLHVVHARTDNTSALSWLSHAARTKRAPIRRLARFCQKLLTFAPVQFCLQSSHIPGILNNDADLISRPESRAATWASVIEQGSPQLKNCQVYLVPPSLLSLLARVIRSDVPEAMLDHEMIRLWKLVPITLSPGLYPSVLPSGVHTTSHSRKRRR